MEQAAKTRAVCNLSDKCLRNDSTYQIQEEKSPCNDSSIEARIMMYAHSRKISILRHTNLISANEYGANVVPDETGSLSSIDTAPETFRLVVIDYRSCLGMEGGETFA